MNRIRTLTRTLTAALLLGLLPAHAQSLANLLPSDTVLALGMIGTQDALTRFGPIEEAWNRHGVTDALRVLLESLDTDSLLDGVPLGDVGVDPTALADADFNLPEELATLDPWGILGREAWLAVSISPFNPLPAVTLLAHVDAPTAAAFAALFERRVREGSATSFQEGNARFQVLTLDEVGFPLAVGLQGDLLLLSSNPEVLRAALRMQQGSSEPNFSNNAAVQGTLGALGEGELLGYLNLGPLVNALRPFASGLGIDVSVRRLIALAEALGPSAGVATVTSDGITVTGIRTLDASRDADLARLLQQAGPAPRDLVRFVPENATSVSVNVVNLQAWWAYLSEFAASLVEFGIVNLNRTLEDISGVNLQRNLVDWTSGGAVFIQAGGDIDDAPFALGFPTSNPDAAERGLDALLTSLASTGGALMGGGPTGVVIERSTVAGVPTAAVLVDGEPVVYRAIASGVAWLTLDASTLEAILLAGTNNRGVPAAFAPLLAQVPEGATSFALTRAPDLERDLPMLEDAVRELAAAEGSEAAADALIAFLRDVFPRVGGSVQYGSVDAQGRIRAQSITLFDLR